MSDSKFMRNLIETINRVSERASKKGGRPFSPYPGSSKQDPILNILWPKIKEYLEGPGGPADKNQCKWIVQGDYNLTASCPAFQKMLDDDPEDANTPEEMIKDALNSAFHDAYSALKIAVWKHNGNNPLGTRFEHKNMIEAVLNTNISHNNEILSSQIRIYIKVASSNPDEWEDYSENYDGKWVPLNVEFVETGSVYPPGEEPKVKDEVEGSQEV